MTFFGRRFFAARFFGSTFWGQDGAAPVPAAPAASSEFAGGSGSVRSPIPRGRTLLGLEVERRARELARDEEEAALLIVLLGGAL